MSNHKVKIGELNFQLISPDDPEVLPSLEIENDASIVFENVSITEALALRNLLEEFIREASDS